MADGFEQMIDAAQTFFGELSENNTKAFYEANKSRYVDDIKKPAEFLANLLADDLSREMAAPFGSKLFRIHRDVRFSKDKTPYNTHLHILWSNKSGQPLAPSWFMGLAQDYFMLGMGVMSPDKDGLAALRKLFDGHGDEVKSALEVAHAKAGATISSWGPDPLKRVPKPYDPEHPHADLLKRKSFIIHADMPATWRETGLVKALLTRVQNMRPVYDILAR